MEYSPRCTFVVKYFFIMLIGELSKRSGFTRDTIRFYEKQGLISLGRKERRVNNYKEYSEEVLRRLLLFKKIKSYGFTLNEAAEIIALLDNNLASCEVISKTASDKIAIVDEKIQELKALKSLLKSSIESCNAAYCKPQATENCPLFDLD